MRTRSYDDPGRDHLIVDDEPAIRRLLRGALERAAYAVSRRDRRRRRWTACTRGDPAVVLLDLGLPDRDGLELIPLIRKQSSARF